MFGTVGAFAAFRNSASDLMCTNHRKLSNPQQVMWPRSQAFANFPSGVSTARPKA